MCNDHDFTHWQGVVGIRDMLVRQCRACGVRDIRVLPPDVEPAWIANTRDERRTWHLWPEDEEDGGDGR